MKKFALLLVCFVFLGCTYGGEGFKTYLEDPRAFIKDPHYKHYKEDRNALESQYLREEISYVDYIEKMKELDEGYTAEVERRRSIIESNY